MGAMGEIYTERERKKQQTLLGGVQKVSAPILDWKSLSNEDGGIRESIF